MFVPSLMLEYMPKCRDFQASLGREDHTLRTDNLSAGAIVERVRALDADRPAERESLAASVTELRTGCSRSRAASTGGLATISGRRNRSPGARQHALKRARHDLGFRPREGFRRPVLGPLCRPQKPA